MSTHPSSNVKQKQQVSVYTLMLIVSALALFIACILLWNELKRYGDHPYWNTRDAQPATVWVAPPTSSAIAMRIV